MIPKIMHRWKNSWTRKCAAKLVCFCFFSFWLLSGHAEPPPSSKNKSVLFTGYPINRYEGLWKRSPFTLSSVVDDSSADFATNLALAGYLKIGSTEYITILNKQSNETQSVSKDANAQGITLISVEPNPDPLKFTAHIRKGSETAVIRYDLAVVNAPSKQMEQPNSTTIPDSAAIGQEAAKELTQPAQPQTSLLPQPERRIIRSHSINPPQPVK